MTRPPLLLTLPRSALPLLALPLLALLLAPGPVSAAPTRTAATEKPAAGPVPGIPTNSKEPIKIDADKLEVFDKDNRAVFSGNVVAIQGETTLRCSSLVVSYERQQKGDAPAQGAAASGQGAGGSSVKRLDCKGGVTVVSKDQIAKGDDGTFDRVANRVTLTGNVSLAQGGSVTTGDKLVYDLDSGRANVEVKPGGRVKFMGIPGAIKDEDKAKKAEAKAEKKRP